jgi:transcriptional regulator GlxA family with amidase domain
MPGFVSHQSNDLLNATMLDQTNGAATRKIVVLGFPGVQALDVVGPFEVFTRATLLGAAYDVVLVSSHGRPINSATGLEFATARLPDLAEPLDTVVLPGGDGVTDARADVDLINWIRAAAPTTRRIVSVCTGAFLAAEAGLLDGRRATTHWAYARRFREEFPAVDVDPEPIFVRSSEKVWTAAGVAAGIDLALSLVDDDHGTDAAQAVARWMVLYLRRPGGQTQFAAPVWMPRARRTSIRDVQEAIEAKPGDKHNVAELARRAAMSPRHFTRLFTEDVGEAPRAYVERVRTEAARRLLEETDDTVATVAARCGFGTVETMRRNFIRRFGMSPDQYRRAIA